MAQMSKKSFIEMRKKVLQKRFEDINTCHSLLSEFWELTIHEMEQLENSEKEEEPPF